MLSRDEEEEIAGTLARYADRRAALPEALNIVQRYRGWVSDESVRDIAARLEMTPEDVDSIATFYSMIFRQPVGRHVILLCDSVSCWIVDYHVIREHLERRLGITLGQTTADNRFTLLPAACLGACDHAPVMMIDDELYLDLTPDRVDDILAQYSS